MIVFRYFLYCCVLSASSLAAEAAQLLIKSSSTGVTVSWPQSVTNDLYLQFSSDVGDLAVWRPTADAAAIGSDWTVSEDAAVDSRFYRLAAWETLFDGNSTSAFRGYQQTAFPDTNSWIVNSAGELETAPSGPQIDIITTNLYSDFELRWESKLPVGGNSGVNYRATEAHSRAEWSGPEYQILDDASYTTVPPESKLGAVWNLIAPTNPTVIIAGQWMQCSILVQSNHVEHWLDGFRVVSYALDSPAFTSAVASNKNFNIYSDFAQARTGYIAFRHESKQVWFRNIKIRQLPPD